MRISTIWTIGGMSLSERIRRTVDTTACSLAYRLPKRVKYWAFIHVGARAMGNRVVPEALYMDVLKDAER